ncbi:type I-E CRISPR-associated protein Cse1/CasA [Lysinibacter sp. HNR]|uniref:type I-E CRISPR-associated protein Cse1/CasA n=1 Tax=Lysinibacter sp. HNR TaxID=3031408 RepID=UPI0024348FA6|nr:type I-E CRISPR-associated protein Cse1/CasA [Lysinibacter sp. HNR]WGD37188.1 type I-E CRISPR-associated protein Cse1/CasA [Lysinibacter sp. HNR]
MNTNGLAGAESFSLITSPLIPVHYTNCDQINNISLKQLLSDAHLIERIAKPEMEEIALLRQILLPLVIDILGSFNTDDEWKDQWNIGHFDKVGIREYFTECADLFFLFDKEKPFGQVADLESTSEKTKPSQVLLPSLPSGNNVPLFVPIHDGLSAKLTPSEAFFSLLITQSWAVAGIATGMKNDPLVKAGKTTGNRIPPTASIGLVIPLGRNLFETIMLSLVVSAGDLPDSDDAPSWRSSSSSTATWSERPAVGIRDYLSYPSRRIRLFPEITEGGALIVERVLLGAGDRLPFINPNYEPHAMWRKNSSKSNTQVTHFPLRHRSDRESWQGLASLLAVSERKETELMTTSTLRQIARFRQTGVIESTYPLKVLLLGVEYGTQNAVIENLIVDEIPLPVTALAEESAIREFLEKIVQQSENVRNHLNHLQKRILEASKTRQEWDKGSWAGEQFIQSISVQVMRILSILTNRPENINEIQEIWAVGARKLALDAGKKLIAKALQSPTAWHTDKTDHNGKSKLTPNIPMADVFFRSAIHKEFPRPQELQSTDTYSITAAEGADHV